MTGNLNNRERAETAWGAPLPRWVQLLADACDRTSQIRVAAALKRSSGYVNRLIHRNYAGSYDEAETIVRAAFGAEQVACPLFGEIDLATCVRSRRRRHPPQNFMHLQFDATCPDCPNNTDRTDQEED